MNGEKRRLSQSLRLKNRTLFKLSTSYPRQLFLLSKTSFNVHGIA